MSVSGLPPWADGPADLQDYITVAHGIATNIPRTGSAGTGVHIGIIDSACKLPDELVGSIELNQGQDHSFISSDSDDTSGHCETVFGRLKSYAPGAEFSIYQAVNEDGKLALGPFADSISRALDDEVDIVNLSAGDPWRGPINSNPNVKEIERLTENPIPVVAAAGNYYPDRHETRPPVFCPSAHEEVISVGGLVTECPADRPEDIDHETGPYYLDPDTSEGFEVPPPSGTYCGERGCTGNRDCITNQVEKAWNYNPLPTGDKPDVLAPMHAVNSSEKGFYLNQGTSFSAPLVTGSVACIMSELYELGDPIPPPHRLRGIVRGSTKSVRGSQTGCYDAMGVRDALGITS